MAHPRGVGRFCCLVVHFRTSVHRTGETAHFEELKLQGPGDPDLVSFTEKATT